MRGTTSERNSRFSTRDTAFAVRPYVSQISSGMRYGEAEMMHTDVSVLYVAPWLLGILGPDLSVGLLDEVL